MAVPAAAAIVLNVNHGKDGAVDKAARRLAASEGALWPIAVLLLLEAAAGRPLFAFIDTKMVSFVKIENEAAVPIATGGAPVRQCVV